MTQPSSGTRASGRALWIVTWFVLTRALVYGCMVLGSFFQRPLERYPFWAGSSGELWFQHVPNRWLDAFGRWDTMFYVSIATEGYPPLAADGSWNYAAAFFPLMPASMRGLSELTTLSPFVSGIVLSNALLFASCFALHDLVRRQLDESLARASVVALLCFPVSHFFSVPYTEALMLFLALTALNGARTGRHLLCALAVGLAILCRPNGWVVGLAVAAELASRRRWQGRQLLVPAGAAAAILVLLAIERAAVGDAFYFVKAQGGWGRALGFPLSSLFSLERSADHHVFAIVGLLGLGLVFVQRFPAAEKVFSAVNLLLPLSTGSLQSVHRFVMATFPAWIAIVRQPQVRSRARVACGVSLVLLAVYAFRWGAAFPPN